MRHLRLRTKIGVVLGVMVVTAVIIAGAGIYQLGVVNAQMRHLVEVTARKVDYCSNMRLEHLKVIRGQKNAVLSDDDADSHRHADKANRSIARVNQLRHELAQLIDREGSPDEKRLLEEFTRPWEEFQKTEKLTLALAVLNTNPKAAALAGGDALDKIDQLRAALNALLKQDDRAAADPLIVKDPARFGVTYRQARLAATTLAQALDLHRLLLLHVNASKEEEKNRLEARMGEREKEVATNLETLGNQAADRERGACDRAVAAFGQYKEVANRARKLSRTNSTVKAGELSAGADRVAAVQCDTALGNLNDNLLAQFKADQTRSAASYANARWLTIAVTVVGILLSLGLALMVAHSITAPVARSLAVSESLARGDLTQRLDLHQRDEIGQLSDALNRLAGTLGNVVGQIRTVSDGIGGSAGELHTVSHELLAQSEQMTTQAGHVASATEEMSTNINTMAAGAEEMSMNVASISSASEEISVNVSTISSAASATAKNVGSVSRSVSEITRSFQDIARDARDSSQTTARAMDEAARATATMNALDRSAGEINKVTEVIKMIALQTNLLALNATIEATSAGEAGKGFAVVAHEIKELANQSARAAEDIARKIEGVQGSTREAVQVIQEVTQIIGAINTSAGRISEAVQKQTQVADTISANVSAASTGVEHIATSIAEVAKGTNDMSRNAAEAAQGANDMSRNAAEAAVGARHSAANIHGVSEATRHNTESAQRVNVSAEQLTRIAGELHKLVGQFKIGEAHE